MVNTSAGIVENCVVAPTTPLNADFEFFATDPGTNSIIGNVNEPINIAAGGVGTFVFIIQPNEAVAPLDLTFRFSCEGENGQDLGSAVSINGVNTLVVSASNNPQADIIALATTTSGDGIVEVDGVGAFAASAINIGSTSQLTVEVDTGSVNLPLNLSLCETDATAACVGGGSPTETVSRNFANQDVATFSIFVEATGTVTFDPAQHRLRLRFVDGDGNVRGATSVAVRTP